MLGKLKDDLFYHHTQKYQEYHQVCLPHKQRLEIHHSIEYWILFTFFAKQDIQVKDQLPANSPCEAVEAEINVYNIHVQT